MPFTFIEINGIFILSRSDSVKIKGEIHEKRKI